MNSAIFQEINPSLGISSTTNSSCSGKATSRSRFKNKTLNRTSLSRSQGSVSLHFSLILQPRLSQPPPESSRPPLQLCSLIFLSSLRLLDCTFPAPPVVAPA